MIIENMPVEKFLKLISKATAIAVESYDKINYKLSFDYAKVIDCHQENPDICQEGNYRIELYSHDDFTQYIFGGIASIKSEVFPANATYKHKGYGNQIKLYNGMTLYVEFNIEEDRNDKVG
jgi:hypothetical protein